LDNETDNLPAASTFDMQDDEQPAAAPAPIPTLFTDGAAPAEASVFEEDSASPVSPTIRRSAEADPPPPPRASKATRRLHTAAAVPLVGISMHDLQRRLQQQQQPPTPPEAAPARPPVNYDAGPLELCGWLTPATLETIPMAGNGSLIRNAAYYDSASDGARFWTGSPDVGRCSAANATATYWGKRLSSCERNCNKVCIVRFSVISPPPWRLFLLAFCQGLLFGVTQHLLLASPAPAPAGPPAKHDAGLADLCAWLTPVTLGTISVAGMHR
jgi:hypothetical protein